MIPNVIHFIFGLEKDFGTKSFSIFHFLALKSAFVVNKPDKIFLYYKYEPEGFWWDKAQEFITPVKIAVPRTIFKNKLCHYAHKADVLRLKILLKYGGIYLDIDTLCIKPFTPLLNNKCVMGEEKYLSYEYGLCNAVILAEQNSKFIRYWLDTYKIFRSKGRDKYWAEHSVIVPLELAKFYPGLIHIEQEKSFFYPSYKVKDLELLFDKCEEFPNAYVFHLWESLSYDKYLTRLTEEILQSQNTSYNVIARKYIEPAAQGT